ncbi:methyl-accepting chemotaxis protein [Paraburkholderia caledonica]|uniref:methyl-accepting chemotaxis protein n=1 Tax=Paraburkholderia caledonica TaxID=134536 RepID=UPI00037A52DA|nr:methyl-accepting chemotaxis protein [Paraburkholderia caledonica]
MKLLISFIDRLPIARKLLLLGILILPTIGVPTYLQLKSLLNAVSAASTEQAGLESARALQSLIQLTLQHRAQAATLLGGNNTVAASREATRAAVDQAIARIHQDLKARTRRPDMMRAWESAVANWREIAAAVDARKLSDKESTMRHTEIIEQYLSILDLLLDDTGLALDSEVGTHYLVRAALVSLPKATATLSLTRSRGAGILARGEASPTERAMLASLANAASDQADDLGKAFDKAFHAEPELSAALADELDRANTSIRAALDLATREIVSADAIHYAAIDYIKTFTVALDPLFALEARALDSLKAQLDLRSNRVHRAMLVQVGLLGMMLLIAIVLSSIVVRRITGPLRNALALANRVADGDLTSHVEVVTTDETGQLMQALKAMNSSLASMVARIRTGAETISTGSAQIAAGNTDLSSRTEEQAASLEESAANMIQLTSTVRHNTESARQGNTLAAHASEIAARGGEVVGRVVHTMRDISNSSTKVANITATIESIAFQTNILALNAAVEAARAGEQGRGFAVVASEVRNLAQRAATAAKEIKGLINESVDHVTAGTEHVDEAGRTINEVVSAVRRLADLMGEIAAASDEQHKGIEQVNSAVVQMDQVTQQNAALVEQATSAAQSMSEQAVLLKRAVDVFKVSDGYLVAS